MINRFENSNMELFELCNTRDDLYFPELKICIHSYATSVVIIDLNNAMKRGAFCKRWLFSVNRWHMDENRLVITDYLTMAANGSDTVAELVDFLRSGEEFTEVDGLTVEIGERKATSVYSPFAEVKPVKLGERLNAATIAKAILSGQITGGRTDERLTDDYAMDAAYDFYRGDIDISLFAKKLIESPRGWRFWWKDNSQNEICAACGYFDYKTLFVA